MERTRSRRGLVGMVLAGALSLGFLGMPYEARAEDEGGAMLRLMAMGLRCKANESRAAGKYAEANARDIAAAGLEQQAAHADRMKEAKAGRSEVNVKVDNSRYENSRGGRGPYEGESSEQRRETKRKTLPRVYTCNNWVDFNDNGGVSYDELIGLKSTFKEGESIRVVSSVKVTNPEEKALLVIYGPEGTKVRELATRGPKGRTGTLVVGVSEQYGEWLQKVIRANGEGDYKAVWYYPENTFIGSCDFTIVPNPNKEGK